MGEKLGQHRHERAQGAGSWHRAGLPPTLPGRGAVCRPGSSTACCARCFGGGRLSPSERGVPRTDGGSVSERPGTAGHPWVLSAQGEDAGWVIPPPRHPLPPSHPWRGVFSSGTCSSPREGPRGRRTLVSPPSPRRPRALTQLWRASGRPRCSRGPGGAGASGSSSCGTARRSPSSSPSACSRASSTCW